MQKTSQQFYDDNANLREKDGKEEISSLNQRCLSVMRVNGNRINKPHFKIYQNVLQTHGSLSKECINKYKNISFQVSFVSNNLDVYHCTLYLPVCHSDFLNTLGQYHSSRLVDCLPQGECAVITHRLFCIQATKHKHIWQMTLLLSACGYWVC